MLQHCILGSVEEVFKHRLGIHEIKFRVDLIEQGTEKIKYEIVKSSKNVRPSFLFFWSNFFQSSEGVPRGDSRLQYFYIPFKGPVIYFTWLN